MKIQTRQFGLMDIDEAKIYTMSFGMPGFEEMKRFVVIEDNKIWPFDCYQSVEEPELCFFIMNPLLFVADYGVDLEAAGKEIGWGGDIEAVKVYVIINTSAGVPEKITANLLGPLLLHTTRFEAAQYVIHDGGYSHQTPVFKTSSEPEIQKARIR